MQTKQLILQPLWSGWRIDKLNQDKELLLETMNLFVGDQGNFFKTNMRTCASLTADRSALIRRVGVFASFDCLKDYEEFWSNCSVDLNMGHRTFHSFDMSDVEVPEEHGRLENGAPKPTHNYGYMGWFTPKLPLEIAPRRVIYAQLHSSPKMVKMMEELLYAPRDDFAGATIFLDTAMIREVC
jgi:hypothetical protein